MLPSISDIFWQVTEIMWEKVIENPIAEIPLSPQTLFPFPLTAKPAVIISCENIFIKIFNIHLKKFQRKFYKNIIFKLFPFHKYLLCATEQISYSIVAKASVFLCFDKFSIREVQFSFKRKVLILIQKRSLIFVQKRS